jgi:hypothetical protein
MGCGCLFALLVVLSPRVALLMLWLFTPLVHTAFGDSWLWPLLGLLFVPSATLMYVLVIGPLGLNWFWGWMIVLFGLVIDLRGYFDAYTHREQVASFPASRTR